MRLIDADRLCEDLLNRWNIADTKKEELIRQVMADIVTPIVVSQPIIEPQKWIPVKEMLPEVGVNVLLSSGNGMFTAEGCLKDDGDWCQFRWSTIWPSDYVDAWMSLPEPYEENKE